MATSKSLKKFRWLVSLAIVAGIYWLHKIPGQLEVARLCRHDGGIKIFQTTFVEGYYDLSMPGYCQWCIDIVALGQLQWLGVKTDPKWYGVRGDPGYYRLVIDAAGGEHCSAEATRWATRRDRENAKQLALEPTKCIGLLYDGDRASGYAFERRYSKIPSGWHNALELYEARIFKADSDDLLAQYRGYSYTSTIAKVFDLGGHIGEPDATCSDPPKNLLRVNQFKEQVLRDLSQRRQPISSTLPEDIARDH